MSDNLPEQYAEPQQVLQFLERAGGQLALMLDPVDAAQFVKQAEAVEYLTRKMAAAEEVRRQATEIVLRAKRRLGELLAKTEMPGRGRPPEKRSPARPFSRTLSDLGISKQAAHEARKVAAVPEPKFEQYATEAPHPTARGLVTPKPSQNDVLNQQVETICRAVSAITPLSFLLMATPTQREVYLEHAREVARLHKEQKGTPVPPAPSPRGDRVQTFFKRGKG